MKTRIWNLANLLTFSRLLLLFPFIYFVGFADFNNAVFIIALILITDILDGYFARKYNIHSRFGEMLDFFVDAIVGSVALLILLLARGLFSGIIILLIMLNVFLAILLIKNSNKSKELHQLSRLNRINGYIFIAIFACLLFGWTNLVYLFIYLSFIYAVLLSLIIIKEAYF